MGNSSSLIMSDTVIKLQGQVANAANPVHTEVLDRLFARDGVVYVAVKEKKH